MLAYSDSFVGDGTSSHGITGIGFQPDVVLVKDIGNGYDTWFRTKDMPLNYSVPVRSDAAGDTSEILSLDADGFTVGSNIVTNGSTHAYVYLALKDDGSGDFSTVSFAGNNTDDTLVFAAWQPTYTLLKTTDTVVGAEKFASQASATANQSSNIATPNYQGAADRADLIYFGTDGMRVSDGSNSGGNLVNRTGFQTYGFVLKDNSATIKTGTYTGTGVNNLAVTVGFQPAFVTLHDTVKGQAIGMYATQSASGNSQQWDGAQQTNLINALTSTGFTLGTSVNTNTNTDTVKYLAIAAKSVNHSTIGNMNPGQTWIRRFAANERRPYFNAYTASIPQRIVFHDACNTSTNYDSVGSNTTFGGNNGMFGVLGASGSMHINFSGAAYVYEGAVKTLSSTGTIFQFYYRPDAAATLSGGNTIFTVWGDSAFTASLSPFRLDITQSTTQYKLSVVDPSNSYASTAGTTLFSLGTPIKIVCYQTSTGWSVYINNGTTPEITYTHTQGTVGYTVLSYGTHYQNAATSYTGVADIDDIWCGNLNTLPTTTAGKANDAYQGYLQNHLSAEGQPYRGPVDGNNLSSATTIDTVSEGAAYFLKLAVQNNDQASFILADNWILANLLRSNSTTGNTQNNAAPTNALNLMAFHYNSANTDGKGIGTIYDANWAGDGDPERAQALLWAHARWGSSALTVGSGGELAAPNYKQRALNVMGDLRLYALRPSSSTGYYYLVNDSFQTGDTVQIGPDYNNPAALKLFAQYDPTNAATWNGALSGTYDILTKAANQIMTGATPAQASSSKLTPDWIAFTLSTGLTSGTPSTYGDSDYGYNAFRTYSRLYDAYVWYSDSNALAALQLPKTFFTNEWTGNSKIRATFKHDGTNTGTYDNTLFTYPAYWTIYANDNANTTASAINTNKLTGLYSQQPYGSIISDSATGQSYSYFSQSWNVIGYMQQNGLWMNYGATTAQLYIQTFTAATTSTGSLTRTTNRQLTGSPSLSFSGQSVKLIKLANSNFTASSSFTGKMSRSIARSFPAVASFVGAMSRGTSHVLQTAIVSSTGSINRRTSRAFLAVVTSVGTLGRQTNRLFTATMSFSGNIGRLMRKSIAATISFTGTIIRSIFHGFSATLSSTGSVARSIIKTSFSATVNFTGLVLSGKSLHSILTAVTSFAGNIRRNTAHTMSGVVTESGNVTRSIAHTSTATVSTNGTMNKSLSRSFTAALSFVGSMVTGKSFHNTLTATVSTTGAIARSIGKVFNPTVSFSGLSKRSITKGMTAAVSSTGYAQRGISRIFNGPSIGFVGSSSRQTNRNLIATVAPTGNYTKNIAKTAMGTLAMSGAIARGSLKVQTAAISSSGAMQRSIAHLLTASTGTSGTISRTTNKGISATLSSSATLAFSSLHRVVLGAATSFSGTISRSINKSFTAIVGLLGNLLTTFKTLLKIGSPTSLTQNETRTILRSGDDRTTYL